MKTFFPRLSRIKLKDWLVYHPYKREASTDHFYIALANDIQHEMLHVDDENHLVGSDYKYLACMMTCYFEDIISKTGIWTALIDEHHRLYGKYLPFYDMEGYERGEINLADIQFLLWHFCSNLTIRIHFYDPYSIGNAEIARTVYEILHHAIGEAPVNDDLKSALSLAPDANVERIRELLDYTFFGCYLHEYYMMVQLDDEILDVKNLKGTQKDIDNRRVSILFDRVSPLLAQSSGQMLARRLGESHPLYDKFMSLSKIVEGYFLYENATAEHLQLQHCISGKHIQLIRPGWEFTLTAGKTIIYVKMVSWGDEWFSVGHAQPVAEFNPAKISDKEKSLFSQMESSAIGIIKRQEDCFLEINQNRRIKILANKLDAFLFIDNVWDTYHLKFCRDCTDRKLFDVNAITFDYDDEMDNLVVFFNPRTGMEFYPNIASCISVKDNPYFSVKAETNIEHLILDEKVSSEFVAYLIENKMVEIEPLSGDAGYHYVWSNCDFLLRYWKKENYVSKPKLFVE